MQDLFLSDPQHQKSEKPEIYVKQWVDYSMKHGLGYILSNGCLGIVFLDRSKIIMDADCFHFTFIETDKHVFDHSNCFNLAKYPEEIKAKVTLLQHFWAILDGNSNYKALYLKALKNFEQIGEPKNHNHS